MAKYIGVFTFAGIIFFVVMCFLNQLNQNSPKEVVELVLNSIASDTAENDLADFTNIDEYYQGKFQDYLTDKAIQRALETRTFRVFQQVVPRFEGTIQISSLELENLKESVNDVELYGTIVTDYTIEDELLFTQTWYIKSRLLKDTDAWKIDYLFIYSD